MSFTRNLKLRLSADLTADARYNLERIDELGSVFPISSGAAQTINSSSDIRLNANAVSLGGDGNGLVYAPNLVLTNSLRLESGPYNVIVQPGTVENDYTLTLPPNTGNDLQFLQTDGSGTLTWADPPTTNFSTLNDTEFADLEVGQIAQYDGTKWRNVAIPIARQTGIFDWNPSDGNTLSISHGFGSTKIQVWIYEPESKSQVFIETIDYVDNDTILLTSHSAPETIYNVHLIQTI